MPYYQGTNYGQPQQYRPMDVPNIPGSSAVSGASGGASAYNSAPTNMNQGAMSSLPDEVINNINAYNPYSVTTAAGDTNRNFGISNYNNLNSQYGNGKQGWIPWDFQAESAGGYGQSGAKAPNLFLPGASRSTQAGSRFSFGANDPTSIMEEQIQRDPMTGEIISYGQAKGVQNNFAQSYLNNLDASKALQQTKGSDQWSPYEQQVWANTHKGQATGVEGLRNTDNEYYGNIDKTFGTGRFDQQNFSHPGNPGGYANYLAKIVNPYQYAAAPAPAQRAPDQLQMLAPPVNGGFQARPDIRNQMGYDPKYTPRSPFTG